MAARSNQGQRAPGQRRRGGRAALHAYNARGPTCASMTALLLLVPSVGFMPLIERFLKADVLAKVGG
jgi:hypothetical protein